VETGLLQTLCFYDSINFSLLPRSYTVCKKWCLNVVNCVFKSIKVNLRWPTFELGLQHVIFQIHIYHVTKVFVERIKFVMLGSTHCTVSNKNIKQILRSLSTLHVYYIIYEDRKRIHSGPFGTIPGTEYF
jgi:hypothetical protein